VPYILSLDPGKSSGIALGYYSSASAYESVAVWQVEDGLEGFLDWYYKCWPAISVKGPEIVSERFVLRSQKFVADTTPLLIEGAMRVLFGPDIHYQLRGEKAKVTNDHLKRGGEYRTGKHVGRKDANDVNDALRHAVIYLTKKKNQHLPTIEKFLGE
jgi:hypothetical protein